MNRVAILGVGLMGGSLGLALKARGFRGVVSAHARRPETREQALKRGAVDEAHANPEDAVRDADLAVLCVPILAMAGLAERCRPGLRADAVVTDVGSTKSEVGARVREALAGCGAAYVGSHPIAGSEQEGLEAARADLYEGAVVVVTDDGASRAAVGRVVDFWAGLGAAVRVMSAAEHDRVMARTSHLPHVAAALVAYTAGRDGGLDRLGEFCGAGFRDTTRIAAGSPGVWHDILRTNQEAVGEELAALARATDALLRRVKAGDFDCVREFLDESRRRRMALARSANADRRPGEA